MKKIIFALSAAVVLASCGGNETAPAVETPKQDTVAAQVCTYSYDSTSTEIGFGAFKFTEKKEVKGSFLKFTIDSTIEANQIFDVFSKAQFKIEIEGLSTKDPGRDNTLKNSFFAAMDSTSFLTGKVVGIITPNAGPSSFHVELKMNNIVREVYLEVQQTPNPDELILKGTINLDDFKAGKALASLNKACKDLHKGSDGKSVTWPEVNIYVSTKLKKNCK